MVSPEKGIWLNGGAALLVAVLTLLSSAVAYTLNIAIQIDNRIDRLEEDAKVLMGTDGSIAPSEKTLDAYYGVKALEHRVSELEHRLKR